MNTKLYALGRLDLIKMVEDRDALLKQAINATYRLSLNYGMGAWRQKAIALVYPDGTSGATAAAKESSSVDVCRCGSCSDKRNGY